MTARANLNKVLGWPWLPLMALIVVNLLIGFIVVRDYGISVDEPTIYKYAANSLRNYKLVTHGSPPADFNRGHLDYYGPAFFMAAALMARIIQHLPVGWSSTGVWHFSYFLSFQIALISLYALCRKWMGGWAAFGAVLLFATQPLLWGHAFINPKDIPFMSAFLASLAIGFKMVDRIAVRGSFPEVRRPGSVGLRNLGEAIFRPFALQAITGFKDPLLLLAGVVLGLTTSVRVLGPYAGMIVVLYGLYKCPKRIAGVIVPYTLVAGLVTYLSWPFLWVNPFGNMISSALSMSEFPWFGSVLFEGRLLAGTDLPARYLPKMMLLQLTEPVILLFAGGVVVAVWKMLRRKDPEPLVLLVAWFIAPLIAIILAGSTVYDNFRQEFFLIPPIFICVGLALDWVLGRITPIFLNILILALIVAPGVYAIVDLHPYEYLYYNQLVGGVHGASRNYELDYWQTSSREAAQIINRIAPQNAGVVVVGSVKSLIPYSRPDIRIYRSQDTHNVPLNERPSYEFVVINSRNNQDLGTCKDSEVVASVKRDGAVLAVIKKVSPGQTDCP